MVRIVCVPALSRRYQRHKLTDSSCQVPPCCRHTEINLFFSSPPPPPSPFGCRLLFIFFFSVIRLAVAYSISFDQSAATFSYAKWPPILIDRPLSYPIWEWRRRRRRRRRCVKFPNGCDSRVRLISFLLGSVLLFFR